MNSLVFGLYFLLLLAGIGLLCAEGLFRFSRKMNFYLSRENCRVLVAVFTALQGALSVAMPVARTLADWGVSTDAHTIIGGFLWDVLHKNAAGIAIGIGLLLGIGAVMNKLDALRRRRPAPGDCDDEVIYGR